MKDHIIYDDENLAITHDSLIVKQRRIQLASIRAVRVQHIKNHSAFREAGVRSIDQIDGSSIMYKNLLYGFIWALACMFLSEISPIPAFIHFILGGSGIWYFFWRMGPYAIVVNTGIEDEIVFLSFNKDYLEKIKQMLQVLII